MVGNDMLNAGWSRERSLCDVNLVLQASSDRHCSLFVCIFVIIYLTYLTYRIS